MDKEKILELAKKQESELTEQDKEYLINLTEEDEDTINILISINLNFIKYLKLKGKEIDASEGISSFVIISELYEKVKELNEVKKLNIDSKIKFIEKLYGDDNELNKIIKPYEKQIEKNNKEKINNEISKKSNELIEYLNEETIYFLIFEEINIPSVTNNKDTISEYIEKGYPQIINYINLNILSKELIEKALKKDYKITNESPEVIRNNSEYIRYAIEHGQTSAIRYVTKSVLEENEDLIYKAIDYEQRYFYDTSPIAVTEIIKNNPKYIRYAIEHGNPNIIDDIPINILEENEDLIYEAIDNGYYLRYDSRIFKKSPEVLRNNTKYIKKIIEHGETDIINYVSEEILKNNIDLIYSAIEKGYNTDYNRGIATKLFLQNEIKKQNSVIYQTTTYNFENSEVSKLFDDKETAYNYIKYVEIKEKTKKEQIIKSIKGFSDVGYENIISSIIEFGDLKLLKEIYETELYKEIIDKQKNKLMKIFPNNFNANMNISDFLNLMNENLVEKINNEKLNSQIAKLIALNMDHFGRDKFNEIMDNKEFREEYAQMLLNHNPHAIDIIVQRLNNENNLLKDKLIYQALDLGYTITIYSDNYIRQYEFIKYSLEKGKVSSLNCIEQETLSKEQTRELFLMARSKNYKFGVESWYVIDNIIDNKEIMNSLFKTLSSDEIIYIFGTDFFAQKIPIDQLDVYLKYFLNTDIDLNKYSTRTTYKRFIENNELLNTLLKKKPIEQISKLDIPSAWGSHCSEFESKLSSEQLICIKYYNKYSFMSKYFDGKRLDKIYDEYIKDNKIWHIAFREVSWDLLDTEKLNKKELFSVKKYKQIGDKTIANEFKKYIVNNFDTLEKSKIDQLGDLFCRLATTNSKALYSMRESLAGQLLTLDNPVESFNKIEKIFIRNNIPLYAKMYFCFKTLYPNLTNRWGNMLFDDTSRMSPELKDSTLVHTNIEKFMNKPTNNDIRFYIIYNDLLRNAVKSNSTDLRKYLDNIELGDYLYKKIIGENITNEKFDNLSELEKKEALEIFTSHLETIYHNTKEGKQDKTDFSNYDLAEKIKYLKENFKTTNKYDLKDRIVRSFGYSAGYTSFEQIRNEMKETIKESHERGIKLAQQLENKPFEFEDGAFLRCIGNYQAFSGSIENGNFSKEFLTVFRETNDSDTTPLDIDFTLIEKKQSIYHSIERTPTGFGFGNVFLVIKKDNPNINITRDKDGNLTENKYDPKKLEMFGTKIEGTGGYQTHWGVRTGMSLTDVDYILFKEERQIDNNKPYNEDGTINYIGEPSPYDDLSKIKFEIARHGYYIPVIDFTGKLIFSVDEYNNLKEKMNGLSYYENNEFKFSNNLEIDGVKEITPHLDKSNELTEIKRNKIYDVITPILEEHNLKLKTKIDGDLTPGSVEIIDTGSTGRGTNKIGDGDFDFLLRIDQKIFRDTQKYEQLKNDLRETIEKYPYESCGITDKGDYRFKKVQLDKDTIVDIDLSFTIKTDKITYSTDECLKDRLKTMEKQDKEKYRQVVSNIILAKQVLKKGECYKPSRSDKNQGGLGGSGIETWILQNGGSFNDAAQDFLKIANTCDTFEEFKKQYFIWDFGENHFAERKGEYPHDNFVDNMNDIGYKKMKECLKQYLKSHNQENMIEQAKTL